MGTYIELANRRQPGTVRRRIAVLCLVAALSACGSMPLNGPVTVAPSTDLHMPRTRSDTQPTLAPHLSITQRAILLDGMSVAHLPLSLPSSDLERALDRATTKDKALTALNPDHTPGNLLVTADRRLKWSVVEPIIAVAKERGITRWQLVGESTTSKGWMDRSDFVHVAVIDGASLSEASSELDDEATVQQVVSAAESTAR